LQKRALAFLAAVTSFARFAHAQDSAEQQAQALFDEGRRLLLEGQIELACPKFARSETLSPSGGTLLNLADCLEKSGKTASALVKFREVRSRAHAAGRADVESMARKRVEDLEAKVATVTIRVPLESSVHGLEVRRDGEKVEGEELGRPIPVDPGAHEIAATAPDRKTWTATVGVQDRAQIAVTVPALEDARTATKPEEHAPPQRILSRRNIALGVGGIGAAGVLLGTVAGIVAVAKHGEATSACPLYPGPCPDHSVDAPDQASRTWATVSTVSFVLGAGGLAAGAVLFYLARNDDRRPLSARVVPLLGRDEAGLGVWGSF
jgi:hypothetical protein